MVIQGRELSEEDVRLIQQLLEDHPDWCRSRLSQELCSRWDWRNARGQAKDMSARSMLLKLEQKGHIQLPPRRGPSPNGRRNQRLAELAPPAGEPIHGPLRGLRPLLVSIAAPGSADWRLFNGLIAGYHYLGLRNAAGENIRYLVRDRNGRPAACLLFGAAAWKCAARDAWIGWSPAVRGRNLQGLANNARFLVVPWADVPCLASHVLGLLARRIRADWQAKYGHPVHAIETFVDRSRHRGTCYQAANWIRLGETAGRTRNDRHKRIRVPAKDVYIYPLAPDARRELSGR